MLLALLLACVCFGEKETRAFALSDGVFRGYVLSVDDSTFANQFRWEFEVSNVWKGHFARRVTVTTDSGTCGALFRPGEEYVVHAVRADIVSASTWLTHCGLESPEISRAPAYLAALGAGHPPTQFSRTQLLLGSVAIVTTLGAIALFVVLKRRPIG